MTVLEPRMDEPDCARAPMAKRAGVTSLFARFIVRSILDGFRIWQIRGRKQRDALHAGSENQRKKE